VPHKLLAVDMVETLDDSGRTWGAVNTIHLSAKEERRSRADSTPMPMHHSLRAGGLGLELRGAKVLLLGRWGRAHRRVKLAAEGVSELHLVNRTESKATTVAKELNARSPSLKVGIGYPATAVDLVLNATSLGLKPEDALPLDEGRFSLRQAGAVYDMVYRPAETSLLRAAKAAGCRTANGIGMLLYQGAKALEIWTGQPAPMEIMRRALLENVYGH